MFFQILSVHARLHPDFSGDARQKQFVECIAWNRGYCDLAAFSFSNFLFLEEGLVFHVGQGSDQVVCAG